MAESSYLLHTRLNAGSGSALIALLWEWFITLDDEVELIWSKPNDSWLKWLFFLARYYIVAASLASRIMEAAVDLDLYLSWSCMKIWYACQVVVALHATLPLEVILMSRMYALYNRERWMRNFFIILLLAENAIVMLGMFIHYPGDTFVISEAVSKLPASFSYFGFCTLVIQFVILYLTLFKYFSGAWKTVPIVRLMFRDGTLAFTSITILVVIMAVLTLNRKMFAIAGFSWLLAAISCVTCRLIVNMLRLPAGTTPFTEASTSIQFTTIFQSVSSRAHGETTVLYNHNTTSQINALS